MALAVSFVVMLMFRMESFVTGQMHYVGRIAATIVYVEALSGSAAAQNQNAASADPNTGNITVTGQLRHGQHVYVPWHQTERDRHCAVARRRSRIRRALG